MNENFNGNPQVLIIGAGPTGLAMACDLRRRGVACRIVDKKSGPSQHSKALGVHARTLELLGGLDVTAEMCRRGREVHGINAYAGGRRLLHTEIQHPDTMYSFILILPQSDTERVLIDRLQKFGVDVEWNVELKSFTADDSGATAQLQHQDGRSESVRTPWLVGCDGAHSAIRHGLELPFAGAPYEESFFLADLHIDWSLHPEMHLFLAPEGLLVCFPLPEQSAFRFVVNEPPGAEASTEDPTLEDFQRWFQQRTPPHIAAAAKLRDPVWLAHFRIHRRQVPEMRRGRVFLAGDAAHIHSPAGGQGMNTSIQDALNLSWKLAYVIHGKAQQSLLDTYQTERHPVAEAVLANTDQMTRIVTLRQPVLQGLRNTAASLLGYIPAVRRGFTRTLSELDISYRDSSMVEENSKSLFAAVGSMGIAGWRSFCSAPHAGDRAPDSVVHTHDGEERRLQQSLYQSNFTLLLFTGEKASKARYQKLIEIGKKLEQQFQGELRSWVVACGQDPTNDEEKSCTLFDRSRQLHKLYGAKSDCLYLIRPDSYIGYRCQPADGEKAVAYLSKIINP